MNIEIARKMVTDALEQRRKFGKWFTVKDMPPEFLDALVVVFESDKAGVVSKEEFETMRLKYVTEHEALVLSNRQLGAATARETKLRSRLKTQDEMLAACSKELQEGRETVARALSGE